MPSGEAPFADAGKLCVFAIPAGPWGKKTAMAHKQKGLVVTGTSIHGAALVVSKLLLGIRNLVERDPPYYSIAAGYVSCPLGRIITIGFKGNF